MVKSSRFLGTNLFIHPVGGPKDPDSGSRRTVFPGALSKRNYLLALLKINYLLALSVHH